jgi:hypothetical protein
VIMATNRSDVAGDQRQRFYNLKDRTGPSLHTDLLDSESIEQYDDVPFQSQRKPDVPSGEFRNRVESGGSNRHTVFPTRDDGNSEYCVLVEELRSLRIHLKEVLERLPIIEARLSECIDRHSEFQAKSVQPRSIRTDYAPVNSVSRDTAEHRERDVPLNIQQNGHSLPRRVSQAVGPEPSMYSCGGQCGLVEEAPTCYQAHQGSRGIQEGVPYHGGCHKALSQGSQTMTHHGYRREIRPETFDGRAIEWDDFLGHFERVCSWNGWTSEQSALQLAMSLRQPASYHLKGLSREALHDFDILKVKLTHKFAPKERQMATRCEFRNRIRQENERATDFKVELQRMASKGWSDFSSETKDAMVFEQFLSGIKDPAAKRHIVFGRPSSLEAAVSLLEEYDAYETALQQEKSLRKSREVAAAHVGMDSDNFVSALRTNDKHDSEQRDTANLQELRELKVQMEELRRLRSELDVQHSSFQRRKKGDIHCYRCGQIGHMSFNCPDKKAGGKSF